MDEVHALAGSETRGVFLSLILERLEEKNAAFLHGAYIAPRLARGNAPHNEKTL